jgi:methylated-DNA-protein-cysteine methyltransferase-like protein
MKPENKDFFERVYEVVKLIPEGRVTSYGAIARFLGSARSARMVGWAMNASHSAIDKIPAHRVVNRNGMLSGKMHFKDPEYMQVALEQEGVVVVNDQIQDFEALLWDPGIELSL